MVGKQLSALLQILRAHGVTRYQTPEMTLELGAAPTKAAPRTINLSPEALDEEREGSGGDEEEMGDPRFLLERLNARHYPQRKGKAQ